MVQQENTEMGIAVLESGFGAGNPNSIVEQSLPEGRDRWYATCPNLAIVCLSLVQPIPEGKALAMSSTLSWDADLIRELRQQLGLSQEKLAAKLGVSFRTVNRWENRRAVPSALATKQIESLLHQMGDAGQELLAKYCADSGSRRHA